MLHLVVVVVFLSRNFFLWEASVLSGTKANGPVKVLIYLRNVTYASRIIVIALFYLHQLIVLGAIIYLLFCFAFCFVLFSCV